VTASVVTTRLTALDVECSAAECPADASVNDAKADGAASVAAVVAACSQLTHLNLAGRTAPPAANALGNSLGDGGASAISRALQPHTALLRLNLGGGEQFDDNGPVADMAQTLATWGMDLLFRLIRVKCGAASSPAANKQIHRKLRRGGGGDGHRARAGVPQPPRGVELGGWDGLRPPNPPPPPPAASVVGAEGMTALAEVLPSLTDLAVLDLAVGFAHRKAPFSAASISALSAALASKRLAHLSLRCPRDGTRADAAGVQFGADGATAVASALKGCTSLQALDLFRPHPPPPHSPKRMRDWRPRSRRAGGCPAREFKFNKPRLWMWLALAPLTPQAAR
jgi:hypothetical protein